ncbi:MAG: GH12 family glycosyl hydrolase domain-containing protein [Myxococcota bacterium]
MLRSVRVLSYLSTLALALAAAGCDAGSSNVDSAGECKAGCSDVATRENNTCAANGEIKLGKYRVLNNLWGMNHTGVMGSQCAWTHCSSSDPSNGIAWGTEYNWAGGPGGEVTSYTAAILGWHFSTIPADSGLPVQLSTHTPINCSWDFDLKQTTASTQNVAYDIWLSPDPAPTGATRPTDEVMIWLFNSGGASPIGGTPVATFSHSSGNWSLSEGVNGSWKVHSFIRTATAECSDLDLNDFFEFLQEKNFIEPTKYVIGIEAGTEVFSGAGTLTTTHFSCEI